jgi:hypothetical protein
MKKFAIVVVISLMLLALGGAQAAPIKNSNHAYKTSYTVYIQASSTMSRSYGMVVSEPIDGNVKVMVLYPYINVNIPVVKLSDGSFATWTILFSDHAYVYTLMPIERNHRGEYLIPHIPSLNMLFETSDDGYLYIPMQDPDQWLPNLPIIVGQVL